MVIWTIISALTGGVQIKKTLHHEENENIPSQCFICKKEYLIEHILFINDYLEKISWDSEHIEFTSDIILANHENELI